MSWNDFDKDRVAFPKVGDSDVFSRAEQPKPDEGYAGKYVVHVRRKADNVSRTISVFPTQLKPVAQFFKENVAANACLVNWIHGDSAHPTWVTASVGPLLKEKKLDK